MTDWMDHDQDKIAKVAWAKEKLIGMGKLRGLARCPCSPPGKFELEVWLSPSNRHVHARCRSCGFEIVE